MYRRSQQACTACTPRRLGSARMSPLPLPHCCRALCRAHRLIVQSSDAATKAASLIPAALRAFVTTKLLGTSRLEFFDFDDIRVLRAVRDELLDKYAGGWVGGWVGGCVVMVLVMLVCGGGGALGRCACCECVWVEII